ncbi:hypothetical protein DSO57_1027173 [Entomophthora muscae]|uniref:Uncharacterized protein n=1 Tax=Entomophthora muscae TaxID=34485 RepID=A0ACC2SEP5_9FUNG|nr:hypothetical protein DSO57_1027173 [Entomophthora muscae]
MGNISPGNAGVWLGKGIQVDHIMKWRTLLPDAIAAGRFAKADFTPEEATKWYNLGADAKEATTFKTGGWNPITVTNWLHTNHLTYSEIHKYIHPTICPAVAIEWKSKGFSPNKAEQWAAAQISIELASSLKTLKIHPLMITDFVNFGYTIDEAIEYNIKKFTLTNAPLQKNR